ncbi:MAG TPA: D-alanyl-D-alanine carboxypeptidase [Clostridiales bacterium]|nr:D-alanyl-D-alanine carboxypeptidase [Clostridiales bacterium]
MKLKYMKLMTVFLCFVFLISSYPCFSADALEFDIDAKSAILMEASSGKVLYEKNPHEKLPPASITKIMTMLLVMEAVDRKEISLDDKVLISERAASMGGSQLYLEPGEEKTVEELLKGVAVASANDAAVALAEYISGTEEMFIKKMNERAKELGMKNTQFMNTNGLPQEGHLTTAYDIGLMSRELLKHPKVHDWLTIWMTTMKVGLPNKKTTNLELTNTNRLIKTYPGANGIKTGYTADAKYCLSASATKNGLTLIAVILGSPTSQIRFAEAQKLLNYGFSTYSSVPIAKKNQVIREIPVEKGKEQKVAAVTESELNVVVKKGEEDKVQKEIVLPDKIKAPFAAGEKIGEIIVKKENEEIGRVNIITKKEIESASFFNIFQNIMKQVIE